MGLLRGLPKGIFRGEERYGAQVDMCHFGLVGSGNPKPSNFRATHMAAATLRPALTPLVADLNGYCTSNAPPWFTWCSIQIVRPQGTDTMGLHSHLRDGAPMALIVCVGSFTGGDFWVERNFQKRGETQVGPPPGGSIGAWHIPPFLPRNGGTFFSFPPSQRSIGMGLTKGGSKIVLRVGPW